MPQRKFDLADNPSFSNQTNEEKAFYSQVKNELRKRFSPGQPISWLGLVESLNDSMTYRVRAGFVSEVIDCLLRENIIEKVGDSGNIYELVSLAGKILPFDTISAPVHTEVIPANCTIEEIKMLVLARLRSILEKHGASYFTVDDFVAILDLLVGGCRYLSFTLRSLLKDLEKEGRVAIVDFSPADIYRIVDEPSLNPQTRS